MVNHTIQHQVKYDESFLKKIVKIGMLGYPAKKIINVLDIENEIEFLRAFTDPKSEVAKHYQKGIDKADFALDIKLFSDAKEGDLKAFMLFESRKRINAERKKIEDIQTKIILRKTNND